MHTITSEGSTDAFQLAGNNIFGNDRLARSRKYFDGTLSLVTALNVSYRTHII